MSIGVERETARVAAVSGEAEHVRVAIVGTGFAGLGMAIRLKRRGVEDFVVLERAEDAGGTWRDNTYPGCTCDVPSHLYSFSFAPNPDWSHHFAPQPEIRRYLCDCIARFGLGPRIRYGCELREAAWDETAARWRLATNTGTLAADVLVLGQGPLSEPALPDIPGLDTFPGTRFHSARWDHAHDLAGERVAVIGTGASAIQLVPLIQPRVRRLALFMRTPPWILPRHDRPIAGWRRALFRRFPPAQRLARWGIYWSHEVRALGMAYQPRMMRAAQALALRHLAAQVPDAALRAKLTPRYTMGCKRILLSDDFYPALTRPNVEVVTEGIREVRGRAIVTADGAERGVDTIILATGFRATELPIAERVRGRDGRTLAEAWRDGAEACLGTTVAGFPNLFLLLGPNTGLGHTSLVLMVEAQLAYVADCLRLMERRGVRAVEVRPEAQKAFGAEMRRRMRGTVWTSGCASWYLDAHGQNVTLWPGFTFEFRRRTRRFDAAAYTLTPR